MRRLYLTIGRDHIHKHIDDFTDDDWRHAREYIALQMLEGQEREERMNG